MEFKVGGDMFLGWGMKRLALFLVVCGMTSTAVAEDVTAAFTKCGATKDDRSRLACYDKIRDDIVKAYATSQQPASGYQSIALVDLKVDLKKLIGKKVSVPALVQIMGEMAMLKSDEMDMAPVFADTEKLPRDDRKKLASGCQMILCKGQFFGTVKQLPLGVGVAVEKVEWR